MDPRPFSARQLAWMVAGRLEAAGELVAALAGVIPAAVWSPNEVLKRYAAGGLNPFKSGPVESEALQQHRAMIAARKLAAVAGG